MNYYHKVTQNIFDIFSFSPYHDTLVLDPLDFFENFHFPAYNLLLRPNSRTPNAGNSFGSLAYEFPTDSVNSRSAGLPGKIGNDDYFFQKNWIGFL